MIFILFALIRRLRIKYVVHYVSACSAFMSMFYQGKVKLMSGKLLTKDKQNVVIYPIGVFQTFDIKRCAKDPC